MAPVGRRQIVNGDVDDVYTVCGVYAGRLAAGDDDHVDITSRSRDPVHRLVSVWTLPQQFDAHCAVCRRDVPPTLRSVTSSAS